MSAAELFAAADALLVDLDGTLVDSGGPVRRVWEAFAERHGLAVEEVLRFAQGRPARETIWRLAPGADHAAEIAFVEHSEVHDTAGVTAFPGAAELLSSGRTLSIVTSCSRRLARARLAAASLPVSALLVTSDDVERGKPDPSCFQLAARRLGVDPSRCVVLEDAPAGIAAGRAAGAPVIALRTTHDPSLLTGANALVDNLASLLAQRDG